MEVTMQWWDDLDDLWFAARLRLSGWHHWASPLARGSISMAALLLVFSV
ncbi:MAG: hypothetical protein AAF004_07145 [Pseudomonadota bacterium]